MQIAGGLSPINPDKAAIEAGRLMLSKIDKLDFQSSGLLHWGTTLSPKEHMAWNTIRKA
jgi:predicted ABC-type ATPase